MTLHRTFLLFLLPALLTGCRDAYDIIMPEQVRVDSIRTAARVAGFYLLNEGNMGSNKASLDYYDCVSGIYTRNRYTGANPTVTMELGDVGNDLQSYGNRLYAVINCSNKIEVMDLHTARRIGQVNLPNCRYIAFAGGYAYATSYAGPVEVNPDYRQRGYVAKIDTATLKIVDTCLVGYQPDGIGVADGKLYVANSGGYMAPHYERALSVIDLTTFKETGRIDVAVNLNRVVADSHHQLWVGNRGDYRSTAAKLYCIDTRADAVTDSLDVAVGNWWLDGDSLYICGKQTNALTHAQQTTYAIVDVAAHRQVSSQLIADGTEQRIHTPYCIFVNPETKDFYIGDAKSYITPGDLYCFNRDGGLKWHVATGDIPAHAVFLTDAAAGGGGDSGPSTAGSAYISKVFEYRPAPGQFINEAPEYAAGDDDEAMRRKAEQYIAGTAATPLSLGGFGGYVVFGFDHKIKNVSGQRDFQVMGNAISSDRTTRRPGGSSEPGIIMVSEDVNGNGLPDDPWYEIAGSEYHNAQTIHNYSITYTRGNGDISWTDSEGRSGAIGRNEWHTQQSYFPMWMKEDQLTFTGTRLPDNGADEIGDGSYFVQYFYDYGYADSRPNSDPQSQIDIDWAVDGNGRSVHLEGINFVKVYTGINQQCGWLGETSTEVTGAKDLHWNN